MNLSWNVFFFWSIVLSFHSKSRNFIPFIWLVDVVFQFDFPFVFDIARIVSIHNKHKCPLIASCAWSNNEKNNTQAKIKYTWFTRWNFLDKNIWTNQIHTHTHTHAHIVDTGRCWLNQAISHIVWSMLFE